jgi:hypothetical protein
MIKRTKPEPNYQVLEKLEEAVDSSSQFTPEEVALIKRLVEAYKGWLFVGKTGKFIILVLATIAGAIAAYDVIIAKVRLWLTIS